MVVRGSFALIRLLEVGMLGIGLIAAALVAIVGYFVYSAVFFVPAEIDDKEDDWWRSIK